MSTPTDLPPPSVPHPRDDDAGSWDVVDQGSWESFPASDPPSWGSSHAAPTKRSVAQANREVTSVLTTHRRRKRLVIASVATGVALLGGVIALAVYRRVRCP